MTMIVAAFVLQSQSLIPTELAADGTTVPINATRTAAGWNFSYQGKQYSIEASQDRYRLSPADSLSVIFSAPDGARPARIGSAANTFCLAIGDLQEGAANALLFPDGSVWSFGDALGGVSSKRSRVVVRAEFSSTIPTLTVARSRPSNMPRVIPENADPLASALARFADRFAGAAHAGPPPRIEFPETEDRALPFALLASLSAGIVDVSAESWNILRGRTGTSLPQAVRMEVTPGNRVPEVAAAHVGRAGRHYVALYVFNYWDRMRSFTISPESIGIQPASYIAFDAWRIRNLGVFAGNLIVSVPAQTCRVVYLRRFENRPQIIGADSHIAGEAMFSATETWNHAQNSLTISARAPSAQPFNIYVSNASTQHLYDDPKIVARNGNATAHENNGFYRIEFHGESGAVIEASIRFSRKRAYPETTFIEISATAATPWTAVFTLRGSQRFPNAGYYIMKNDAVLGYTADSIFSDDEVTPLAMYSYTVIPVSFVGIPGSAKFIPLNPGWPNDSALHRTPYAGFGPDLMPPRLNMATDGTPLTVEGRPAAGISIAAGGNVEWVLARAYVSLEGTALSLTNGGRIRVLLDGDQAWIAPSTLPERFTADLSQAHRLRIEAIGGEAALINATLKAKPRP